MKFEEEEETCWQPANAPMEFRKLEMKTVPGIEAFPENSMREK